MLLAEFDPARDAVINPDMVIKEVPDFPETVVSVFSHHLFHKILDFFGRKQIAATGRSTRLFIRKNALLFIRQDLARRPASAALKS